MTQQLQPASRKPDKRRKYDEAFKAEALRLATESRSTRAAARQLGISEKLLYRWQQARAVAEASSTGMARDPEVRALRAANKRLAQEVDILKSLGHLRPADPVSVYQHIATCQPQQPVRRLCQVLGASPTYYLKLRSLRVVAGKPPFGRSRRDHRLVENDDSRRLAVLERLPPSVAA